VDLNGRVLVVTGGAAGIGRACAELWREYGGRAAILDVSQLTSPAPNGGLRTSDLTSGECS
jgi:NAD(P)-dependent dehydrogenase (short-subunit alcohol dehydrogenase family)